MKIKYKNIQLSQKQKKSFAI